MRPAHIRLVAVAGVLAVVLGVAIAFVVGRDGASPAQPVAAPATSLTPDQVAEDRTAPEPTTPTSPTAGGERAAKAAAVTFLRELGMRDPVAASYRKSGAATAEVGIHPRAGEGGRPFDKATTLVQLRRYTNGWVATGAKALDPIEVEQPLAFARIRSPLTVSGTSLAYEGTVHVTVTEDRRGADHVLGKGFVTGGGSEPAPFRGPIKFARPAADAGWVVFSGDTGADIGIVSATAVRIQFATSQAPPTIAEIVTTPAPTGSAEVVTLTGSGKLLIHVRASGASELRFLLVPSGTGNRPNAKLLGVVTRGDGDGRWSFTWRYPDAPLTGHLLVQANGPGGTTENDRIGLHHA